jgi:SAM-dependent methyltransferase
MLADADPELLWGWGSPAGKLRAARRGAIISAGAHLGAGTRALEIGCGTGMFTEMFTRTGTHLLAVDISGDLLAKALLRKIPRDKAQFMKHRFEDIDLKASFDAVIGSSILHHLDIIEALQKIYSLLKPGGYISFAEPNLLNPQVYTMFTFRRWFPEISPDENPFLRWKLERLLSKTGFENIKIIPLDWMHPHIPAPLIPAAAQAGRCLERLPVIREFAGSLFIQGRRPLETGTT